MEKAENPQNIDETKGADAENCPVCTNRQKHREEKEYKALITRLNRIEGQVRGVRKMVEEERYCVDILTQVSAISSALHAFNRELLASHIRTCVAEDIRQGNDGTIEELCATLQKLMR